MFDYLQDRETGSFIYACTRVTDMNADRSVFDRLFQWIIEAEATGNSMMKERYDQMVREELPEEEFRFFFLL